MLLALISIISYLITILGTVVMVNFVLALLISFNMVSHDNQYVEAVLHATNVILDPFLNPIKRIMPTTIGMFDLSPMILLIGLRIIQMLLGGLYMQVAAG